MVLTSSHQKCLRPSGFGYAGPYVAGTHTMSNDYYYLNQSFCY